MKCQIPEIGWHNRDPVFSIDFQPKIDENLRLASGGSGKDHDHLLFIQTMLKMKFNYKQILTY
jgi:hypothetical protein